jgi:DNA-binding MarR family transcriptional regulator
MGNEIDHSILQPLGRRLSRLGKSYLHLLNARLYKLDIERNYYALLLIEQGNGSLNQNELAGELETDKVSIVRIVDYLTVKGYVERVRSATDKRKYCLTLTEKARKAIPGIRKAMADINASALSGLTDEQKSEFSRTLETIKNNLNQDKNSRI